jgi:hypothetical protein
MRPSLPTSASRTRRPGLRPATARVATRAPRADRPGRPNAADADDERSAPSSTTTDLGLKAAWFGAEAVGNLVGAAKAATTGETPKAGTDPTTPTTRLPFSEAAAAIRADYEAVYFVSGKGDLAAYDPDCYFADPFAGFSGTARFVRNVSNLGSTLSDVRLKLTAFEEDESAGTIRTAWTFSGVVDALPWRPRLAAAGSTTHTLDPASGRVVRHIEAWSSSPGEVVAALLRPASPIPSNRWERAAAAAASGDVSGCAAAGLKAAALVAFHAAGVLAAARLVGGSGGSGVSAGEAFLWGGGAVQAALDAVLQITGTPGAGRPARRKDRR